VSESSENISEAPFNRKTREVKIGRVTIGSDWPVVVQSMCATPTSDVRATVAQVNSLAAAGAGIVRIAADNDRDVRALETIRGETSVTLSVDLQENYRVATDVSRFVDKIRYNPGHLYHFEPERPWQDKVRLIVDAAGANDCAIRIGVNCGSVDPAKKEKFSPEDSIGPMVESAVDHSRFLDSLGFTRYCVSLKDSDPQNVIEANRKFAALCPLVPLHLGVTEAGMPPEGIFKSRLALEPLLADRIGETLRISLTVPGDRKTEEIVAALALLDDLAAGRRTVHEGDRMPEGLNIISCPSCSRVENGAFVELAQKVSEASRYAAEYPLTIAVMGCRVNGPGETDDADLGVWCGAHDVNLKVRGQLIGRFSYDEIINRIKIELDKLIAQMP
jgi:(E)-4-hydroxy-3-methylbut-2-enyl-diphosphate synthase